jgi:hypothetical protein
LFCFSVVWGLKSRTSKMLVKCSTSLFLNLSWILLGCRMLKFWRIFFLRRWKGGSLPRVLLGVGLVFWLCHSKAPEKQTHLCLVNVVTPMALLWCVIQVKFPFHQEGKKGVNK